VSQLRLRPLGFGEILDGAFTLYRRNFPTFFTTALLVLIPVTLLTGAIENVSLGLDQSSEITAGTVGLIFLALPLMVVLYTLLWAALTRQVADAYEGDGPSLRSGYSRAARAFPRMLGAGIILAVFAVALVMGFALAAGILSIPVALLGAGAEISVVYGGLITLAGFVGMLAAMASAFAVVPVIVIENLGPWGAITRSHKLAGGARARIVGILLVSSLIVLLPTLGMVIAAGMGSSLWDVTAAATLSPVQIFVQQFVTILTSALTTPFMVGCMTLLYFDRRVRTEGYDLEVAADSLAAHALT
jgi:hypothetical protein